MASISQYAALVGDQNSPTPGSTQIVDPLGAARVRSSPLDLGTGGGHYRYAWNNGTTGAAYTAAVIISSIKWGDPVKKMAILRLSVSCEIVTAVTAQYGGWVVKAIRVTSFFTADITNGTQVLATSPGSGKMNTSYANSTILTGAAAGTGSSSVIFAPTTTAGGATGGTGTADTNSFAFAPLTFNGATTVIGANTPKVDLYNCNLANGEAPLVLGQNEGVRILSPEVTIASGTVSFHFEMDWVEYTPTANMNALAI
jgi:hypothetical protein